MDIVIPRNLPQARLEARLLGHRLADDMLDRVVAALPLAVRQRVIVRAAVRFRLPDQIAGGYCGPDGITFKDLCENA